MNDPANLQDGQPVASPSPLEPDGAEVREVRDAGPAVYPPRNPSDFSYGGIRFQLQGRLLWHAYSRSTAGLAYIVDLEGEPTCTCWAFSRSTDKTCLHLRIIAAALSA